MINALDRGQLPCSSGEARILRLAASLAEGIPIDLRDALTGLDSHNSELVTHAVQPRNRTSMKPPTTRRVGDLESSENG